MDLLGIGDEDDLKQVFLKALDHATFWKEMFTAEGNPTILNLLMNHKSSLMVARSIDYFKDVLKGRHLGSYSKICETKQKLQGQWMVCCKTVDEHITNIHQIDETFKSLLSGLIKENIPSVIINTIDFLRSQQEQVTLDELSAADILQEENFEECIRELSESCNLLLKIIKSRVFWNILQKELSRNSIKVSADDKEDTNEDALNGITLSILFGDDELDKTKNI
ncbi:unnamed protein product [Mytilus coruscus]|uniref:Uncharacterized protein n=1 Tax=Mytilus coruscus TaxID=42192 RepID=A0A6J8CM72_MYTCO|nr:unnamed protein product [Mytilus coruscus]